MGEWTGYMSRVSHNGPQKVVLDLGVASGQYNLPWAINFDLTKDI